MDQRCDQCDTCAPLIDTGWGLLCEICAMRQVERDSYGYGLTASTFGFTADDGPWED